MKKIAYIKKDYPVQTVKQLKKAQMASCDQIYIDDYEYNANKELMSAVTNLMDGDSFIIYSLKVLLIFSDAISLFSQLAEKNIRLIVIEERIDTAESPLYYQWLLGILKLQGHCRSDKSKLIFKKMKDQNIRSGRPTIQKEMINRIQKLRWHEKRTYRYIMDVCDVSLGTVQKYANDTVLEEVFSNKI